MLLKFENLNELIDFASQIMADDLVTIKNAVGKYVYVSSRQRFRMGFNNYDWFHKSDENMPCEFSSTAKLLYNRFEITKNTKNTVKSIQFATYASGFEIEHVTSSPILNLSNEFIGELSIMQKFQFIDVSRSIIERRLKVYSHTTQLDLNYVPLSSNEEMVLFLYLLGYSQGEIQHFFEIFFGKNLSTNTIKTYYRRILSKFEVSSKEELLKKAADFGYNDFIPNLLLKDNVVILEQN